MDIPEIREVMEAEVVQPEYPQELSDEAKIRLDDHLVVKARFEPSLEQGQVRFSLKLRKIINI